VKWLTWIAIASACSTVDGPHPQTPAQTQTDDDDDPDEPSEATPADAARVAIADAPPPLPPPPPPPPPPEVWLRGSTHVHARPSGDSQTPIADVIRWYEAHGYDFIALTDHNQVSEVDPWEDTVDTPVLRDPSAGLIVLAGVELTHNPSGCRPAGDPSGRCRIHVNLIGVTARPHAKLTGWIARNTTDRIAKYQGAIDEAKQLGGIAQLDHPQWFWGMTPDVLVEVARRGIVLYEVANVQFAKWNAGDKGHLSTEALWDAALGRGATLWGVASDDAHDYYERRGKYPAGGGYVMVKARRDPQAILDALATGRFYASTGVTLERAEVERGELVVEIAASDPAHAITFVENGKRATVQGKTARWVVPVTGYVRAVVERADGARAWTQPARR